MPITNQQIIAAVRQVLKAQKKKKTAKANKNTKTTDNHIAKELADACGVSYQTALDWIKSSPADVRRMKDNNSTREILTQKDLETRWALSSRSIRRQVKKGLKVIRFGGAIRYSLKDVEAHERKLKKGQF